MKYLFDSASADWPLAFEKVTVQMPPYLDLYPWKQSTLSPRLSPNGDCKGYIEWQLEADDTKRYHDRVCLPTSDRYCMLGSFYYIRAYFT